MKGLVLDGLLDYLRASHGEVFTERLLSDLDLPSKGVYTSVGTYDAAEMFTILRAYCEQTGVAAPRALSDFGRWMFPHLIKRYVPSAARPRDTFELLRMLDGVIHVEVRKLYPDAELPEFTASDMGDGSLRLRYRSSRRLEDFAEGLIHGSAAYFGESIRVQREADGDATVFTLSRSELP